MIDILIPSLGRPQNSSKVAASLAGATDVGYRLIFICSAGDKEKIAASKEVGEVMIVRWKPDRADFAKKINYAFPRTSNEWVFQGADDIDFRKGWDHAALVMAKRKQKSVIGTNDLHNPAVKQRRHATHILFRRDYITRYGTGTWDNTGLVFCELYDHQFVDTEFVEVAMWRNEWAFCDGSVVEHLHPYWGLSPRDATYDKAVREAQQDLDLYMSRSRLYDYSLRQGRREDKRARRQAEKAERRRQRFGRAS